MLGAPDKSAYVIDYRRNNALGIEHALYSSERLAKILATVQVFDAKRVVTAVIDDVSRFIGGAEQADDITLLAVRRVASTAT